MPNISSIRIDASRDSFPDILKEAFISSYTNNKENKQLAKFNIELCGLKGNYLYNDEKIYRELCSRK